MKVLVFTEQSLASRYWEVALAQLQNRGIDVHLACLKGQGPLTEAMLEKGIPSVVFGARNSKDYPFAVLKLASYHAKQHFDIIHASESIPAGINGLSAMISRRCVRLFHRHHNVSAQSTRLFDYLAHRTADLIVACSESTARFAHEIDGAPLEKIRVAYNGIDPLRNVEADEIRSIKSGLGIPAAGRVISIVGRLREEKGHKTAFKAADIISKKLAVPLSVVIVGTGPYEEELRKAATEYTSFSVYFVGHKDDVAPWFSIGDVVAVPSFTESFGLAAAEAMSCGRPLVASGVGGLLEVVVNGESGLLVPPQDEQRLAAAITEIIEQPDLARKLGDNGRLRVNKLFTTEKMIDGWIRSYDKALSKRG